MWYFGSEGAGAGEAYTYATHPFAVSGADGRERGVYVAGSSDELVTISADRRSTRVAGADCPIS